ncbi:Hypothetical predicted protein, partial [Marmota monax]
NIKNCRNVSNSPLLLNDNSDTDFWKVHYIDNAISNTISHVSTLSNYHYISIGEKNYEYRGTPRHFLKEIYQDEKCGKVCFSRDKTCKCKVYERVLYHNAELAQYKIIYREREPYMFKEYIKASAFSTSSKHSRYYDSDKPYKFKECKKKLLVKGYNLLSIRGFILN